MSSSTACESGISIASVVQKEVDEEARTAEIVLMTHLASEQAMRAALAQFEALGVHRLVLLRDFGDMAGGPSLLV